ncbi:hypothetical protein PsorP6_016093 [Peronosclerospora sorghi]|uniref:Uncharacterized protein n=1 Tax=Peronosclerospora sorghi TaxID=230839 RepID=A0ACC0WPV8_9STRA|nr:hypothetical protein PsorP6_016093 [Peronosclerospora sorghi]
MLVELAGDRAGEGGESGSDFENGVYLNIWEWAPEIILRNLEISKTFDEMSVSCCNDVIAEQSVSREMLPILKERREIQL